MSKDNLSGPWGEAQAGKYLQRKGYRLISCNYRCRFGEIDLIVQNKKYVVFVEVKLRKSDRFAQAKEFVTSAKQERVRISASLWLQSNPTDLQPRFDVIEIYAPNGVNTAEPVINHLEDAF